MANKIISQLLKIKLAQSQLQLLSSERKNNVLKTFIQLINENQKKILSENLKDLIKLDKNESKAFTDRLTLNSKRLLQVAESIEQIIKFEDPIGKIVEEKELQNHLYLKKTRAPLGVIYMIYESRPNVALDAFALSFKTGNALILKGGKESFYSSKIIYQLIHKALESEKLNKNVFWGLLNPSREITLDLMKQKKYIDVLIPRGGEQLIDFVVKNSLIPLIKNDRGLCHIYLHEDAPLDMSLEIVNNAKTQRPGVCNAVETLLIHKNIAERYLPLLYNKLIDVKWYCCSRSYKILKNNKNIFKANTRSFETEYLDLKINCKIVDKLEKAIQHIEAYGSHHSESIVTLNQEVSKEFQNRVDAACVYWNASTRFTDGFEFALGGEIGISTQKLHVRGPVGLNELTSLKWIINGTGQIRS